MNAHTRIILTALGIVAALLITGCALAPTATPGPALEPEAIGEETTIAQATTEVPPPQEEPPAPQVTADEGSADENPQVDGYTPASLPNRPNRMIVKNAELKLLVADTDVAIDRVAQVAADTGGYIISSRVRYDEWLGKSYKYASITIGVPVDQFELAMRRMRQLALQVVDESASGQDVTDEYVDLDSRLGNLIATRDRIREFLDQATTVEESLRVNEQLAAIEEQIEQVQGRMNYLFDRAAYSTITVQLDPDLPQPTPAPTPTPTPIPTPTPTPTPWTPVQTAQQAGNTLASIVRVLARFFTELTIWTVVVILPLVGPPALILWVAWRLLRRWHERQARREAAKR